MANYKLSTKAAMDIADIYEYGILQFGIRQAQSYLNGLEKNLGVLVKRPELSRKAEYITRNLYRFKYRSHIIFFTLAEDEAFVVRILEQHRDFPRHL